MLQNPFLYFPSVVIMGNLDIHIFVQISP
nr:unnamed protein product [Callosobruchus analis]